MSRKASTLSLGEEIANSVTHGVGLLMRLLGLVVLVEIGATHDDPWQIVGFSVFGTTLVLLYAASMACHPLCASRAGLAPARARRERLPLLRRPVVQCVAPHLI